jgi:hypothetical protein
MDDDARKLSELQLAADVRKFEIGLFWQRSLFFWGLIAATFLVYANLKDSDATIRFAIVSAGFIFSLGWTLVNRGSKFWQENWERKVELAGESASVHLFRDREPVQAKFFLWRARQYSVSKLAIALSDFTVAVWVFLGVRALHGWETVLMAIVALLYASLMCWKGRTSRR